MPVHYNFQKLLLYLPIPPMPVRPLLRAIKKPLHCLLAAFADTCPCFSGPPLLPGQAKKRQPLADLAVEESSQQVPTQEIAHTLIKFRSTKSLIFIAYVSKSAQS